MTGPERVTSITNIGRAWTKANSAISLLFGAGSLIQTVNTRVARLLAEKARTNDDAADTSAVRASGTYLAAFATSVRDVLASTTDLASDPRVVQLDAFMSEIETEGTALASA